MSTPLLARFRKQLPRMPQYRPEVQSSPRFVLPRQLHEPQM